MSRLAPPDGPCVHCLVAGPRTWDHLLPEAWYPDSTPADMEKWVVPACEPCNAEYGRIERRTLLKFGLGIDPWTVGGEGIGEKAFRAMDPHVARNEKDRKHRADRLEKFKRDYKDVKFEDRPELVFPNIGTIGPPNERGTLMMGTVDWADVDRMIVKFCRGLAYLVSGEVLTEEYRVEAGDPRTYAQVNAFVEPFSSVVIERAPGFYAQVYYSSDDGLSAIIRLLIWGKYEFFGSITKSVLFEKGAR